MPTSASVVMFRARSRVELLHEELPDGPAGPQSVVIRAEASLMGQHEELASLFQPAGDVCFPFRPRGAVVGRVVRSDDEQRLVVGQRVFTTGTHASVQAVPANSVHVVPEEIDGSSAVYALAVATAMAGVAGVNVGNRETVAVFGLGPVGLILALLLHAAGRRVIALDPLPERCQRARRLGLAHVFDDGPEGQVAAVLGHTGGIGAAHGLDTSGESGAILSAILSTGRAGQVTLLAAPRTPFTANVTPALQRVHGQGITLRTPDVQSDNYCLPALDLISEGAINLRAITSHIVRPADVPETYRNLQAAPQDYAGVVIDWR
jgi:threonine dehydrogenase-like Zn-dependent dehydrogenase